MALDCSTERSNSVKELVDAMRQIYVGISLPEALSMPPPEDINAKKLSIEICLMVLKYLKDTEKKMSVLNSEQMVQEKNARNKFSRNLERFNKA